MVLCIFIYMYTKKTLQDILQSVADKHDAGVYPASSSVISYWTRIINDGIVYCADRLRLEKSTTISISSGTATLPDDFLVIRAVLNDDGNPLEQISKTESANSSSLSYWITGDHLNGYSLNTNTDGTYTIYYNFHVAPLVNNTDICIIPDIEAIAQYAYSKIRKAETDPLEDADGAMAECQRRLEEMVDQLQTNDAPLMMTLQQGA